MNDIRDQLAHRGLMRPRQDRVIGGVIAGLGRRFGIDPWPARLLFLLVLLVLPGSQLVVYVLLWILMPAERPGVVTVTPAAPSGPPKTT